MLVGAVSNLNKEGFGPLPHGFGFTPHFFSMSAKTVLAWGSPVALAGSIGKTFHGVITGANEKGVYVRIFDPPVEGKVVRGEQGLDVGDVADVTLLHTDPQHAFIDFARS